MTVAPLVRTAGFQRLFAARLLAQLADGVFQASLAGAVFFNPEHQTDPSQAAIGFLVLYLPYSVVSPFVGVFLDRWRRQRSLLWCCLIRVPLVGIVAALMPTLTTNGFLEQLPLYVVALAVLGLSRFFISAAGAAMPHVVDEPRLVTANAIAGTTSTIVAFSAGIAVLVIRSAITTSAATDAAIALVAAGVYLVAAAVVATGFHADELGPLQVQTRTPLRREAARVVHELTEGAAHLRKRPVAVHALGAMTAYRLCMGALTLDAVLLYRNAFAGDHGLFPGGQVGLGEMVSASTVGVFLCAVATPRVTRRIGKQSWIASLLVAAGVTVAVVGPTFRPVSFLLAGFMTGVVGQGVKICVDTIIQESVDDSFRGRAFAFYDALFNCAFALSAVAAALLVPLSGRSLVVVDGCAAVYLVAGVLYGREARRSVAQAV